MSFRANSEKSLRSRFANGRHKDFSAFGYEMTCLKMRMLFLFNSQAVQVGVNLTRFLESDRSHKRLSTVCTSGNELECLYFIKI